MFCTNVLNSEYKLEQKCFQWGFRYCCNFYPVYVHGERLEPKAVIRLRLAYIWAAAVLSCLAMSCLVLQNNQQSSSWSITLMVVVGHGMRTDAHLASWALKAAGFSCSTTTAGIGLPTLDLGIPGRPPLPSLPIPPSRSPWALPLNQLGGLGEQLQTSKSHLCHM